MTAVLQSQRHPSFAMHFTTDYPIHLISERKNSFPKNVQNLNSFFRLNYTYGQCNRTFADKRVDFKWLAT